MTDHDLHAIDNRYHSPSYFEYKDYSSNHKKDSIIDDKQLITRAVDHLTEQELSEFAQDMSLRFTITRRIQFLFIFGYHQDVVKDHTYTQQIRTE